MVEFTVENLLLGAICIGIATVAVLYFTGKLTVKCDSNKSNYSYGASASYSGSAINSGCGYLAETVKGTPNEKEINNLCAEYQQVCGNGSTTAEILGMDLNFNGPNDDGEFLNTLQQDVLTVKMNSSECAPLLTCNPQKMIDCPPFLSCENGSCN